MDRSVVLITIDCLRQDHLSVYGYDRDTTPFLNSIKDESILFENAYANGPGTSVSFPAIFSSTYPFEHGGYSGLSSKRTPVAEILQSKGVQTFGVHSNTFLSSHFGYNRGFNTYLSNVGENDAQIRRLDNKISNTWVGSTASYGYLRKVMKSLLSLRGEQKIPYWTAEQTTDKAIRLVEESTSPFFLWVHYMDVHAPHHPPDDCFQEFSSTSVDWDEHHESWTKARESRASMTEDRQQEFIDAYDAEIRYVDRELSRLVSAIESRVESPPLFMITSDHGEELFDHGKVGHQHPHLYQDLIDIPLILYSKSDQISGDIREDLVDHLNIAPTILSWFNLDTPEDYRGTPLLGQSSKNGIDMARDVVFSEVSHRSGGPDIGEVDLNNAIISAIHKSGYQYINNRQNDSKELFKLQRENHTVTTKSVPLGSTDIPFEDVINSHLSVVCEEHESEQDTVPDDIKQQLHDLGYTG